MPVGDHAVLVEFATEISDDASRAVIALDRALSRRRPVGVVELVPAYVNLLVDFDPTVTDHVEIETAVRAALQDVNDDPVAPTTHLATVCFEGDLAPDLDGVAEAAGLRREEVIATFLASTYRVAMYGFAPGYAYLAGVDRRIQMPRKAVPVRGVAAGSVIIAGPQCLITTLEMPTGWSVIGRSSTRVHRPDAASPFLFAPGDEVRFERVDSVELDGGSR
jgi:inhibitor of KinA